MYVCGVSARMVCVCVCVYVCGCVFGVNICVWCECMYGVCVYMHVCCSDLMVGDSGGGGGGGGGGPQKCTEGCGCQAVCGCQVTTAPPGQVWRQR